MRKPPSTITKKVGIVLVCVILLVSLSGCSQLERTSKEHTPPDNDSKLKPTHLISTAPKPSYNVEFDLNSAKGFEVGDNGTPELTLEPGSKGEIDLIISHTPCFNNTIVLLLTCYGPDPNYDYWILAGTGSGGRNLTLPKGVTYKFSNQLVELHPNESLRITLTLHADSDAVPGVYKISLASYVLASYGNGSTGHRGLGFLLQIKD